jgi:hypothetical protein
MTAIHQAGESGSGGHASHQFRKNGIVSKLTRLFEIDRNEGLVVPVLFFIVLILEAPAVPGIVEKGTIATLRLGRELAEGINDIVIGWGLLFSVVLFCAVRKLSLFVLVHDR